MMHQLQLTKALRGATPAAAVAAVLLLIGGCGGSTSGLGAGQVSTKSPSAAGAVLNVTGTEYAFTPSEIKVSAGRTTIRFSNKGVVEHDFTIDALHVSLAAKPGKTAETTISLTPGTYKLTCTVPGHSQSGMQGTVTVS